MQAALCNCSPTVLWSHVLVFQSKMINVFYLKRTGATGGSAQSKIAHVGVDCCPVVPECQLRGRSLNVLTTFEILSTCRKALWGMVSSHR